MHAYIQTIVQQQHCLRNHWFKKLSPSDSRATTIIHTTNARIENKKSRVPLDSACQCCLRWFCSRKMKPRNSGSRFHIPRARRKALTKLLEPSKAVIKPLLGKPRTPQKRKSSKFKKSSPSISYFGFFPIWQSLISALIKPLQNLQSL